MLILYMLDTLSSKTLRISPIKKNIMSKESYVYVFPLPLLGCLCFILFLYIFPYQTPTPPSGTVFCQATWCFDFREWTTWRRRLGDQGIHPRETLWFKYTLSRDEVDDSSGGFIQIFFIFTPKIGEDEAILTNIFSDGLKPPTSYLSIPLDGLSSYKPPCISIKCPARKNQGYIQGRYFSFPSSGRSFLSSRLRETLNNPVIWTGSKTELENPMYFPSILGAPQAQPSWWDAGLLGIHWSLSEVRTTKSVEKRLRWVVSMEEDSGSG